MKKVSVIIPVYNGEKCIKRCLDSIIAQDFNDFDVIIVNDGSTDNTKEIVNQYVEKYNNIKQYVNDNHGVSYSRNYGIINSKSEYVVFIDSDDILKVNYLSTLVNKIEKGYDLICCGYDVSYENKYESNFIYDKAYSKSNMNQFISDLYYKGLINPVWNKIFRMSIIKENNIIFKENLAVGEDLIFVLDYLSFLKKDILVIKDNIYIYYKPDFFSGKRYGNDYFERNVLNDYLLLFYNKNNFNNSQVYNEAVINMYTFLLYDGCTKENIKIIKNEKKYQEVLLNINKLSLKYKLFLFCIKNNFIILLKMYLNLKRSEVKK